MITLIDRIILFMLGCTIIGVSNIENMQVIYILIAVICVGVSYYEHDLKENRLEILICFLIIIGSFAVTGFVPFVPIILYSFAYKYLEKIRAYYVYAAIFILMAAMAFFNAYRNYTGHKSFVIASVFLSIVMAVKSKYIFHKEKEVKRLRDDSKEKNNLLEEKNRTLLSNLDKEIHIAVLSERNRIAREIHDNVGHLLSRSILQVGAIMAVSKDENVKKLMVPVRSTLDEAMNSIRESVHDLHKESFDIENAAKSILEDLKDYDVSLECDISMEADKDVKYAFLTILKEAVNNIEKHCDGDRVEVLMRELDEYYQMVIEDNGVKIRNDSDSELSLTSSGIGLVNMQDRIKKMQGMIRFSCHKGFRIFISVPKYRG